MIQKVQIKNLFLYADDCHVAGKNVIQNGYNYEPHIVRELEKWIPTSCGFLDLGANCGLHTVAACTINPNVPIFAVEISPRNIGMLARTVRENPLPNVTLLPFAVADKFRIIAHDPDDINTGCNLHNNGEFSPALPLDLLDLPPIDLVKADIEGFELLAWKGMSKVIARKPRIIFELCFEMMPRANTTAEEELQWLLDRGYKLTVLDYVPGTRRTFDKPEPLIQYVKEVSKWITDIIAEPA